MCWIAHSHCISYMFLQDHWFEYPILSRIARDYLAIPGSSVPAERSFSSGRHIGTDFRNRISLEIFESLQVMKNGYKEGLISVVKEIEEAEDAMDKLTGAA